MMEMNFEKARYNMIEQQIRPWDVLDQAVLDLMRDLPREDFVPAEYRAQAYTDLAVPLADGEVMMPPKLVARMLQALKIKPTDKILEIGTGSGYVTALMAKLGHHVYSVDIHAAIQQQAAEKLRKFEITNVTLQTGDAAQGWANNKPYDVIAITGSLPILPKVFEQMLSIDGRLFVIVGDPPAREATLVTRSGENEWQREVLFETDLPQLRNVQEPERFVL